MTDTKVESKTKKEQKRVLIKPYPSVQPRKELLKFFAEDNARQSSLFIQAFTAVQFFSTWDLRSFFRIGGIHGLPYEAYGDDTYVPNEEEIADDSRWWGYCQHGTVLFPTWHRPYVRLLEQVIRDQAIKIVAEKYASLTDGKDWETAADTLRFPFFDWSSITTQENGVPFYFTDPTIKILDGTATTTVNNPLRAFTLPQDLGSVITAGDRCNPTQRPYTLPDNPYSVYTPKGYATVRYPTSDYVSNDKDMNNSFKKEAITVFRTGMWHVFQQPDYEKASNHYFDGERKRNKYSLEGVHDNVHGAIGGNGGHMSDPSIAGMDPIFFFHHCNVDRMFAIWQACYPDSWMTKDYPPMDGSRVINPEKDKLNSKTKLIPFRNQDGEYFTSDDVRDTKTFGYTYPDITGSGPEFLKKILAEYAPLVSDKARLLVNFDGITKRKLGGPFSIRVFVGEKKHLESVNADSKWLNTPNFAGTIHVFARSKVDGCPTCKTFTHSRAALDVTGAMVLSKLEKKDEKTPLTKDQVKIVIVKKNGQEVSMEEAGVPQPTAQLWLADSKELTPSSIGTETSTSPSIHSMALLPTTSTTPTIKALQFHSDWNLF